MSERDWEAVIRALRTKAEVTTVDSERQALRAKADMLNAKYGPFDDAQPNMADVAVHNMWTHLFSGLNVTWATPHDEWLDSIIDDTYLYDDE
jgi:hypothetical protein